MTLQYYTGVGSRETPENILAQMTRIGETLARKGMVLRSGGADGADSAFEAGCDLVSPTLKQIYLPWRNFNGRNETQPGIEVALSKQTWDQAELIAKEIHPVWERLSQGAQKLHIRNVFQVLGGELDKPSSFVIYWALTGKNGEPKGGTRTAVMLAKSRGISTYNLAEPGAIEKLEL